jgi:hypothetical protein
MIAILDTVDYKLNNLINNTILITLIEQDLEIEFILYISKQ